MSAPMSSLSSGWLADLCRPAFDARYLGREPFVLSRIARSLEPDFDWSRLELASLEWNALARSSKKGDLGEWVANLVGFGPDFRQGTSFSVPAADRHCAVLRALRTSVESKLGRTHLDLAVMSAQTRVDWGYDADHKFILQTSGTKDFYFRPNTVLASASQRSESPALYSDERSRLWMARLSPGDILYLPARWWHRAECLKDSLTVTLTVSITSELGAPEKAGTAEAHLQNRAKKSQMVWAEFGATMWLPLYSHQVTA